MRETVICVSKSHNYSRLNLVPMLITLWSNYQYNDIQIHITWPRSISSPTAHLLLGAPCDEGGTNSDCGRWNRYATTASSLARAPVGTICCGCRDPAPEESSPFDSIISSCHDQCSSFVAHFNMATSTTPPWQQTTHQCTKLQTASRNQDNCNETMTRNLVQTPEFA